jgi:gluconokinase
MIIVITGVAGVGKTTVGQALAKALGWAFYDADDLHAPEDRERMRRGEAMTDTLRQPWLERIRAVLVQAVEQGEDAVLACSALKQQYRERLSRDLPVQLVFLTADREVLRARLQRRTGHFAGASLLETQLAALEPPSNALTLDATLPVDDLVEAIRRTITRSMP